MGNHARYGYNHRNGLATVEEEIISRTSPLHRPERILRRRIMASQPLSELAPSPAASCRARKQQHQPSIPWHPGSPTHLLASSTILALRSFKLFSRASTLASHAGAGAFSLPLPFPSTASSPFSLTRACKPSRAMSEEGVGGVALVVEAEGVAGATTGRGGKAGSAKKPAGGCLVPNDHPKALLSALFARQTRGTRARTSGSLPSLKHRSTTTSTLPPTRSSS